MNQSYEINKDTLAIIPIDKNVSRVVEVDGDFIINKKSTEIIDDSCKYYGSSYQGRFEGTKKIIGVNYKSPIIVEETRELIFFPTASPRFDQCAWICVNNIEDYMKSEEGYTSINFKNGKMIDINMSLSSFENQMIRSLRLANILKKRKLLLK